MLTICSVQRLKIIVNRNVFMILLTINPLDLSKAITAPEPFVLVDQVILN